MIEFTKFHRVRDCLLGSLVRLDVRELEGDGKQDEGEREQDEREEEQDVVMVLGCSLLTASRLQSKQPARPFIYCGQSGGGLVLYCWWGRTACLLICYLCYSCYYF